MGIKSINLHQSKHVNSGEECRAHNPKVAGSKPAHATLFFEFFLGYLVALEWINSGFDVGLAWKFYAWFGISSSLFCRVVADRPPDSNTRLGLTGRPLPSLIHFLSKLVQSHWRCIDDMKLFARIIRSFKCPYTLGVEWKWHTVRCIYKVEGHTFKHTVDVIEIYIDNLIASLGRWWDNYQYLNNLGNKKIN